MSQLTIALLFLFLQFSICVHVEAGEAFSPAHLKNNSIVNIDSADLVFFDFASAVVEGDVVDIPVLIETDDIINALDFSIIVDTNHLIFQEVIDHTGELMLLAYVNPNDSKLRFTSNSFSPYPHTPQKVISLRFKVVGGFVSHAFLNTMLAYLNGDRCSSGIFGKDILLANEETEINNLSISPNPAYDFININLDEEGTLDMFDMLGHVLLQHKDLHNTSVNQIDVRYFPRGNYTISIVSRDNRVRTQQIVLQ